MSQSYQELISKADTLHEALPYFQRFSGQTVVVKYGGHAMIDPELQRSFARDIVMMRLVGIQVVVVHGGGPQIDKELAALGVVSERIDGLRVTDERTMEVVEMVLSGRVNHSIVALINNQGGRAVGLNGHDDCIIRARKIHEMKTKAGRLVDPGRVGAVTHVRDELVRGLVGMGYIPIIAPVAVDDEGRSLNVNADTIAGAVSHALGAAKLVLMTDIEGVKDGQGKLIPSLTAQDVEDMKASGVISGGMIPKVDCALDALRAGTSKVHIIDGRLRHAVLLEVFTDQGVGTEIRARA
ncbi:MAG TPA: acetylglutamate kinase [Polyangiales bacterium]|nr:acetylglutamate kinase [Polyangiales bacterium]